MSLRYRRLGSCSSMFALVLLSSMHQVSTARFPGGSNASCLCGYFELLCSLLPLFTFSRPTALPLSMAVGRRFWDPPPSSLMVSHCAGHQCLPIIPCACRELLGAQLYSALHQGADEAVAVLCCMHFLETAASRNSAAAMCATTMSSQVRPHAR